MQPNAGEGDNLYIQGKMNSLYCKMCNYEIWAYGIENADGRCIFYLKYFITYVIMLIYCCMNCTGSTSIITLITANSFNNMLSTLIIQQGIK